MRSRSSQAVTNSANAEAFRRLFVERTHRLLQIGYSRMRPADYATTIEPVISGEIRRHIREFLDEGSVEKWMRFFTPLNEDPVDETPKKRTAVKSRTDDDRRLLDLHLECSERCPRIRFAFEAKRLNRSGAVGIYLSEEGLGRFIAGHYARNDFAAGMLGYVQVGKSDQWANAINKNLTRMPRKYSVSSTHVWKRAFLKHGPEHTYCSHHKRPGLNRNITIYHTLLHFY
jgi:hypothetical protein